MLLVQADLILYALLADWIKQIEITLRSALAVDCIAMLKEPRPEIMVAAGTVLSVEQLTAVKA